MVASPQIRLRALGLDTSKLRSISLVSPLYVQVLEVIPNERLSTKARVDVSPSQDRKYCCGSMFGDHGPLELFLAAAKFDFVISLAGGWEVPRARGYYRRSVGRRERSQQVQQKERICESNSSFR